MGRITVFIDIDGVFNDHTALDSFYCGIDYPKVVLFNKILEEFPEVEIVISSAWRYLIDENCMTLKGFECLLLTHGFRIVEKDIHRLVGATERDKETVCEDGTVLYEPRHLQVLDYVEKHAIKKYLVIDDLELDLPEENFHYVNGDFGLNENDYIKIVLKLIDLRSA